MSDAMNGPGDHEDQALALLQAGGVSALPEAQVYATLALAAAVNRFADVGERLAAAHESVASALADRGGRVERFP
jgi:hypothetical protein